MNPTSVVPLRYSLTGSFPAMIPAYTRVPEMRGGNQSGRSRPRMIEAGCPAAASDWRRGRAGPHATLLCRGLPAARMPKPNVT